MIKEGDMCYVCSKEDLDKLKGLAILEELQKRPELGILNIAPPADDGDTWAINIERSNYEAYTLLDAALLCQRDHSPPEITGPFTVGVVKDEYVVFANNGKMYCKLSNDSCTLNALHDLTCTPANLKWYKWQPVPDGK